MSNKTYREDHRLRLKVVEAKNLSLQTTRLTSENLESYCIVGIQNKLPEHRSRETVMVSTPQLASPATGSVPTTGPGGARRPSIQTIEMSGRLSSASAVDLRRASANTNAPGVTPTSGGGLAMSIRRGSLGDVLGSPRRKSSSMAGLGSARSSVAVASVAPPLPGAPRAVRTKAVVGAAPFWGEEWEFELDDSFHAVILQIHKKTIVHKDPVIGQLLLPIVSLDVDNKPHEDWFALQTEEDVAAGAAAGIKSVPSPHRWRDATMSTPTACWQCKRMLWHDVSGHAQRCELCGIVCHKSGCVEKIPANCGSVGTVRVWYSYTREPIMPLRSYGRLKDIILDPSRTALRVFSRVCEDQEDAALHILQIAECAPGDAASDFVTDLCVKEILDSKEPATLFRANSMATKTLDVYMKLIGMDYLREVLQSHIRDIMRWNKDCEIDPMKMEGETNQRVVEDHLQNLESYIITITKAITSSHIFIPSGMRSVLTTIYQTARTQFPNSPTTAYTSVTSFLFLRFFTAAILGPKLWTLLDDHPPPRQARTFTLISKTMQQAANMTEFDGVKEPFTSALNPSVQKCMELIKGMVNTVVRDEEERRKKKARRRSSGLKRSMSVIRMKLASPSMQDVRKKSFGGTTVSGTSGAGISMGSSMHVSEGSDARGSRSMGTLDRAARRGTLNQVPEGAVVNGSRDDDVGVSVVAVNQPHPRRGLFAACCGGGDDDVAPAPTIAMKPPPGGWSVDNLTSPPLDTGKRSSSRYGSGGLVPMIPINQTSPSKTTPPSPTHNSSPDITSPKAANLIDVERHLAAMHRHFSAVTDKMQREAQTEDEKAAVSALNDAVREIQSQGTTEERKRMRMEQLKLVGAVTEMEKAGSEGSVEEEGQRIPSITTKGGVGMGMSGLGNKTLSLVHERVGMGMEMVEERGGDSEVDLVQSSPDLSL
ncbi:hypothetical protein HDV00_010275 [Rhizophlyctis rosea]|nr:hypothetical protein HDV00_010275 [Rhizophlyctis rosea]